MLLVFEVSGFKLSLSWYHLGKIAFQASGAPSARIEARQNVGGWVGP